MSDYSSSDMLLIWERGLEKRWADKVGEGGQIRLHRVQKTGPVAIMANTTLTARSVMQRDAMRCHVT